MEVLLSSVTASSSASRWIPNLSSIRPLSTSSFCGISSSNSQPQQKFPISRFPILSSASSPSQGLAAFSVPLAASLAVLLWSAAPVEAGILSGSSGLESIAIPAGLFPASSSSHTKTFHLQLSPWERGISISSKRTSGLWKISVAESMDVVPEMESSVEKVQQVVPAVADDGIGTTVVSVLLTVAFVGLSILTIGVIYIAVTDFLQKREREKFEKEEEEAAKKMKGKSKKKRKVNVRAGGPRGFGQKITDADADDQDDD